MKQGYYIKNENPDHFWVAIADVSPAEDDFHLGGYFINRINVPYKQRGNGLGSSLLKMIIADADAERVDLYLVPVPSGQMTLVDLEAWYMRYGFKWDEGGLFMKRSWKE